MQAEAPAYRQAGAPTGIKKISLFVACPWWLIIEEHSATQTPTSSFLGLELRVHSGHLGCECGHHAAHLYDDQEGVLYYLPSAAAGTFILGAIGHASED